MSTNTIGVLLSNLNAYYNRSIWSGIEKIAKEQNINVLYFSGGLIENTDPYRVQSNIIYEFIDSNNVDGLIIVSGTIGVFISHEKLNIFINKYKSIPKVSISVPFKNIPHVLIDNKNGMKKLIYHLINVHKYKKIAFIRGPEENHEAQIRFDAYKEVLNEFMIEYNPELVLQGNFTYEQAREAVRILLDRNVEFEAVVAANDDSALGVMDELKERDINVPDEVAVTGFDDSITSKASLPSITTVKQPLFNLGKSAIEMLLAIINGEKKCDNKVLQLSLLHI